MNREPARDVRRPAFRVRSARKTPGRSRGIVRDEARPPASARSDDAAIRTAVRADVAAHVIRGARPERVKAGLEVAPKTTSSPGVGKDQEAEDCRKGQEGRERTLLLTRSLETASGLKQSVE